MSSFRVPPAFRLVLHLVTLFVFGMAVWATCQTIHWPMIGDASLTHYSVFLMTHGRMPYRAFHDVNLPGTYFVDWVIMSTLGWGALAWRIYDIVLSVIAASAMAVVAPRPYRMAGVLAASMLVLIHLRDGVANLGQRDLTIAVLELLALALLSREQKVRSFFAAGVLLGFAAMIKPVALLAAAVFFVYVATQPLAGRMRAFLSMLGGLFVAPVLSFAWLLHDQAEFSFVQEWFAILAHSFGKRLPVHVMFSHLVAPIAGLLVLSVIFLFSRKVRYENRQTALLLGLMLAGALQFLVQTKGFAYHRYPFLLFALLLWAIASYQGSEAAPALRILSVASVVYAALVLTPHLHARIVSYDGVTDPFSVDLTREIALRGASRLDRRIQCLDTFSGCIRVLYQQRLEESTGLLYDENLWTTTHPTSTARLRAQFLGEFVRSTPCVIIVTPQNYPMGPDGYDKLDRWPEFSALLNAQFKLAYEFKPTQPVRWEGDPILPLGYRLYESVNPACLDTVKEIP